MMEGGDGRKTHLVHHIFQRVGTIDCETDKEQIGFWVGERAQAIVFLLPCRVP